MQTQKTKNGNGKATTKAKASAQAATTTEVLRVKPMSFLEATIHIDGVTPLVQHAWSQKAIDMMAAKHAGKKTKNRDVRDPEQDFRDAMVLTVDGNPAVPAMAIKSAIIGAAHKDLGIEKTLVRKALFIYSQASAPGRPMIPGGVLPMTHHSEPIMRTDYVRVGMGSTDLRYRPEFTEWQFAMRVKLDADLLRLEELINLIDRAGFGIGIGEMRPERGGDYGRFGCMPGIEA